MPRFKAGRFIGGTGDSSSSSSLPVRSMTGAAGRFLLEKRMAEDGVDASRDLDWAGVRSNMAVVVQELGSRLMVGAPGSVISIRSSSPSPSLAGVRPPRFTASFSLGADQTPSGSTTTDSVSLDVESRISLTYLLA